jgi:hypothetical protein
MQWDRGKVSLKQTQQRINIMHLKATLINSKFGKKHLKATLINSKFGKSYSYLKYF